MNQSHQSAAERVIARRYRTVAIGAGVLLTLLIVTALLAAALWLRPTAKSAPAPVRYETATVWRGPIEKTVTATGKLDLLKYIDVAAQISGQISDVDTAIGDTVKAGEHLIEIAPAEQPGRVESNRAQLARLRAELAGQTAQLDFAQLQYQRQTQLKEANATREESVESSRMAMFSASAKVDAINAQIQQTEAAMKEDDAVRGRTRVVAPIGGTVVALSAREGQIVNANRDVLLRIADLGKMTVQALVAEEDVTRLVPGMIAYFTTPGYPGKRWSGKLRRIVPLPANGSGQQGKRTYYNVLFDVVNGSGQLMSGMSADVWFVLEQDPSTLQIPASALPVRSENDGSYRLRVITDNGQIATRLVKVGIRTDESVQVLEGLAEGEQVIVATAKNTASPAPAPASVPTTATTPATTTATTTATTSKSATASPAPAKQTGSAK